MRDISIFLCALLVSLILTIIGCGGDDDDDEVMDTKPPEVKEVIVAGDMSSVATNGPIMVVLSEDVDPASVHGCLALTPQTAGDLSCDEESRTLTFCPESDLQAHSKYSLTVGNLVDKAGNVMEPYTLEFSTGERDATPPTIVKTIPEDGELEALPISRFTIEFNERVDQTNFGQGFSLTPDTGVPVDRWLYTWSEDGKEVKIFIPREKGLETMEDYTLHIDASSVMDLVGNEIEKSADVKFTTVEPPHEDIDPRSDTALTQAWLYIIWKDASGVWHITWGGNTAPGAAALVGTGSIFCDDGEITDVREVAWEAGDIHDLIDGVLTFNGPINGTGGTDGLTFKATGKMVTFDLKNAQQDEDEPAIWVHVGKDRKNPSAANFTLVND